MLGICGELYETIAELGKFFRELCSRNLRIDVINRLKRDIVLILCKLEKIYPPAFFDVMVHLAVQMDGCTDIAYRTCSVWMDVPY